MENTEAVVEPVKEISRNLLETCLTECGSRQGILVSESIGINRGKIKNGLEHRDKDTSEAIAISRIFVVEEGSLDFPLLDSRILQVTILNTQKILDCQLSLNYEYVFSLMNCTADVCSSYMVTKYVYTRTFIL